MIRKGIPHVRALEVAADGLLDRNAMAGIVRRLRIVSKVIPVDTRQSKITREARSADCDPRQLGIDARKSSVRLGGIFAVL